MHNDSTSKVGFENKFLKLDLPSPKAQKLAHLGSREITVWDAKAKERGGWDLLSKISFWICLLLFLCWKSTLLCWGCSSPYLQEPFALCYWTQCRNHTTCKCVLVYLTLMTSSKSIGTHSIKLNHSIESAPSFPTQALQQRYFELSVFHIHCSENKGNQWFSLAWVTFTYNINLKNSTA